MVARVVAYMLAASVAVLTAGEIFQGGIITYKSVPSVLAFGLVLGLLNAFIHAKDAWAIMPEALWLSSISALLAFVAAWIGFSGIRTER